MEKKKKLFPKEIFVTMNDDGDGNFYLASETAAEAYDGTNKTQAIVAKYTLDTVGKVTRTITTDWED